MNILFIAYENSPFNPRQGAGQRSSLLLQACVKAGNVDVIDFCGDEVSDTLGANIIYNSPSTESVFRFNSKKWKLQRLAQSFMPSRITSVDRTREQIIDRFVQAGSYDYIVIRYALPAINCGLYKYASRLIVDVDDNPAVLARMMGRGASTFAGRLFFGIYAAEIAVAMKRFDRTVRRALYSNEGDCKTRHEVYMPNIPFYERTAPLPDDGIVPGRLLFVGDMTYEPNIQGVNRFLSGVYQAVRERVGGVSFHIVGRCSDARKTAWESVPGVTVTGFVPSLEQEYAQSSIVVLPVYGGGGTCIKFLEAAQMGRPVVTTGCGFRGYSRAFTPAEDCLVASDDAEFSRMIVELLGDEDARRAMAARANEKMLRNYSRETFESIVLEVLG